jgi:hypothetical protein
MVGQIGVKRRLAHRPKLPHGRIVGAHHVRRDRVGRRRCGRFRPATLATGCAADPDPWGAWLPVGPEEAEIPDQFHQDAPTGACYLVDRHPHRHRRRPATVDECEGRERATIWTTAQVVERIQDL